MIHNNRYRKIEKVWLSKDRFSVKQVASWIKLVEKDLILASAFDCDLVEKIESAAIAGHPVLLQDLSHSISSALYDILDKVIIGKLFTMKI